jgi:hypothetical protein
MTDTLDKLKKAFEQAISTATSVQPWNEPLARREAIQTGQVFTAPIVQGGLGSWVGSSGFPYTGTDPLGVQTGDQPPARNSFEMGLGLPGVPDVDFVPYAWNTNRFGGKGPALIGHPISWEVVGPTLKSPYCDWQWHVDTTGLTNDVLTLEAGPYPMPGASLPVSVLQGYNYDPAFDSQGGLYVLFTFTGENFTGALTGRTPISCAPNTTPYRASFEIFRVDSFLGLKISLRGEKRVSSVFTGVGGDGCRAITLIRPKVTRLAAFPVPVTGQVQANRTFVFLPPENAAASEYMPPYASAGGPGTWSTGGFDVTGAVPSANVTNYGNTVKLPIPKPLARVDAEIPIGVVGIGDEWNISVPVSDPALIVGRIVRVSGVSDSIPSGINSSTGSAKNTYGYFEIRKIAAGPPDLLQLRRVTEANPDTGEVFYGNGPIAVGTPIPVSLEVYDNITSFFSDTPLNIEKLAATRLTNLIDPRTVGPSISYRDVDGSPVPASKPDRVIFNTRIGSDPGNLLDLGFRTVIYPAKLSGGDCVPDFDKPLDSNNVTLDPAVSERQFIEIDYSAGVAYLSHTPDAGNTACDVTPNGFGPFAAANNPREEIVLYAACVPYSMEEGQSGAGLRVTGSSLASVAGGFGTNDLADVFGRRIITEANGFQTLNPAVPATATVTTTLTSFVDIPPSGFFFVGFAATGLITLRFGPYYYQYTDLVGPQVRLNGITGPAGAVILDPAFPDGSKIILQRSFRSFSPVLASADTVRGSSKRISTLAFKNADITFGADGSITIEASTTLQRAYEGGNSIDVTTANGSVAISNSTDSQDTLVIDRSFIGGGVGVQVGMQAGTTSSGIVVTHDGTDPTNRGLSVVFIGAGAKGTGLKILHAGVGTSFIGAEITLDSTETGFIVHQNGSGDAIRVIDSGNNIVCSVADNGITTASFFLYRPALPIPRNVVIPLSSGAPVTVAGVPEWDLNYATLNTEWVSLVPSAEVFFPLHIPNNCDLVNVLVVVDPKNGGLGATANRMQAELLLREHDFTIPVPAPILQTTVAAECDDDVGGGNLQTLDLKTSPNLGFASLLPFSVTITSAGSKEWILRVRSNATGATGDNILSIQVQLSLKQPAPL